MQLSWLPLLYRFSIFPSVFYPVEQFGRLIVVTAVPMFTSTRCIDTVTRSCCSLSNSCSYIIRHKEESISDSKIFSPFLLVSLFQLSLLVCAIMLFSMQRKLQLTILHFPIVRPIVSLYFYINKILLLDDLKVVLHPFLVALLLERCSILEVTPGFCSVFSTTSFSGFTYQYYLEWSPSNRARILLLIDQKSSKTLINVGNRKMSMHSFKEMR